MNELKYPLPETLSKALMDGIRKELGVYSNSGGFFNVPDADDANALMWEFDSNQDYIQVCVESNSIGQTILPNRGVWTVFSIHLNLCYRIDNLTSAAAKHLFTATEAVERVNGEVAGLAAICQTPQESFDRGAYQIKLASLVASSVHKITKGDPLILKSPKGITKSGDVHYMGHCYDIKVLPNNRTEISLRY